MATIQMTRKEELRKELREIEVQEQKEIAARLLPELRKKYVGKCFKSRDSYGVPSTGNRWYRYDKILSINEGWISAENNRCTSFSFAFDNEGKLTVYTSGDIYTGCLGEEISEEEFKEAWVEIARKIKLP